MTLRLSQKQGGYDPELGWTGNRADVPTVKMATTDSVPGKDGGGSGRARVLVAVSFRSHGRRDGRETNILIHEFDLTGKPEGKAGYPLRLFGMTWARLDRWKTAIERFLTQLQGKVEGYVREETISKCSNCSPSLRLISPIPKSDYWAKFPDIKWLLGKPECHPNGRRRSGGSYTPPSNRIFVTKRQVPWWRGKTWQEGTASSLDSLAIYLIASHHGKVRTVSSLAPAH